MATCRARGITDVSLVEACAIESLCSPIDAFEF